jgi:hypothetical protein
MIRLTGMLRFLLLYSLGAITSFGQGERPDPAFATIPFDEWLKGAGESHLRWSLRIVPPHLSVHQRLITAVSVSVDGSEFVKRSKPGQVVLFVEFRDREDRVYRSHSQLEFAELQKPEKLAEVNLDLNAFITPGDYRVAAAIYDLESKEHSLKQMKLHVPELGRDALAGAWKGLPAVEFAEMGEPPERWFLPDITSRMVLPLKTGKPVRVEIVVNESPTETAMGRTGRMTRRNMSSLIPALKVISQMDVENGSMNVTLLDLERRKVSFAQQGSGLPDWKKLKAALAENDPNKIDVHALENHEQNAQFFVSEVRKRLEGSDAAARVLIVLSGPMAFAKGQDLTPIEAVPGCKVFYIRYYPSRPDLQAGFLGQRGRGARPPMVTPPGGAGLDDSLVGTLKPLAPRRFDVTTAMEFRAALGAIMSDISQIK